jgi:hypothetical protein
MIKVDYKVSIAGWSVDSTQDPKTELVELKTFASMDSPVNDCRIALYAPSAPSPSLLQQAVGAAASAIGLNGAGPSGPPAFSIDVRGKKVKFGDSISIDLIAGDVTSTVLKADVQSIHSSFGLTTITGTTGMQKLAGTRINQVYSAQTLGQIVRDLASQAGVNIGSIDDGGTYSYFVVHESRNVLAHIRELASLEGTDLYFDSSNQLNLTTFQKTSPDHTFYFGIDILDVELLHFDTPAAHVIVYGESPVSNQGSDAWPWIAKDLSPFRGEVGKGAKLLTVGDRSLRTKEAADHYASAKLGAITDQSAIGHLRLMGNPKVNLGDAFEVKNAKPPELNGLFKVTSVQHVFSKVRGYLTVVGFSGQGGAQQAGSLLGAAAQLSGALGL